MYKDMYILSSRKVSLCTALPRICRREARSLRATKKWRFRGATLAKNRDSPRPVVHHSKAFFLHFPTAGRVDILHLGALGRKPWLLPNRITLDLVTHLGVHASFHLGLYALAPTEEASVGPLLTMSSSFFWSPASNLDLTPWPNSGWTTYPNFILSSADNRSTAYALVSDGTAITATLSTASRFVLLARLSPLLIIGALALFHLVRRLGQVRYARPKATPTSAAPHSFFSYFAPFVTQQDVQQHLRPSLHTPQPHANSNHSDTSSSEDAESSSLDIQGYQRQRHRINKLLSVSLVQPVAWATALGWTLASSSHSELLPSLAQISGWIAIFVRLLVRPPQTPSFDLVALLLGLLLAALVDLFSFIPLLAYHAGASRPISTILPGVLLSITNAAACVYAASLCLRMPVTPGGYEAVVDLDERLRHQSHAVNEAPFTQDDMASTYRLCPTSPEDYCSLYENLSYSWMAPIQKLALRRSLNPTDVWRLRSINDTRLLFRKFKALEHAPGSAANKPRLLSRILRANANDILLDACFKLISVSFAYLGTYVLKSILDEIQIASTDGGRQSDPADTPSPPAWSPRQNPPSPRRHSTSPSPQVGHSLR